MTRDGLVDGAPLPVRKPVSAAGSRILICVQARDSPDSLENLSAKVRHTRQQKPKDGDTPQAEPVEDADASPLEDSQPGAP